MKQENIAAALPDHARVWIYGANRPFTAQEEAAVSKWLSDFISGWNSHGNSLTATAQVLSHQIIVFAVDEAVQPPSGCSIDKSVALLREIEKRLQVVLLDGGRVFYKKDDDTIAVLSLPELRKAVAERHLHPETPVLNMQAGNIREIKERLFIPAAQSWMARYFR
ncbi:hypothetical protein [Rhodoflexus sp.]